MPPLSAKCRTRLRRTAERFSGEWQTVWTTLVVRLWYSQEFMHRELWRNAAEFESARKQTMGLKLTKTGDDGKASGKRITIQLKSGNSCLRTRKGDGSEVFGMKDVWFLAETSGVERLSALLFTTLAHPCSL